ncbi:MAG: hypothetical protein M0R18_04370, partial [Deltaproteobacteria bacterium]|nr:hypothetical protein [Deltaproteobacteria bacterium]
LWAMTKWYRADRRMHARLKGMLKDLYALCGWKARIAGPFMGVFARFAMGREQKRLESGWTYEPPTFCEKNSRAMALESPVPVRESPMPVRRPVLTPEDRIPAVLNRT